MDIHIIIVEDEANIAESLSFLMEREGFEVTVLTDGAGAADHIAIAKPQAVVLDVMLPNRSGFDVLQDLRNRHNTASLPIMLLTAKGQARDRERALELGADAFVTKPFSNTDIIQQVKALIAERIG